MIVWDSMENPEICKNAAAFREFARQAAAMGATHIAISQIPPSTWQHPDKRDPFPQWDEWPVWSRRSVGLFKLVLPPQLKSFLPEEESRRNIAIMKERCSILKSLGLRAVIDSHEPMWLPEAVFQKHPEWRGAQVECMPLARLPYFSPCVDNPEVLDMYRSAMAKLCRQLPELDVFTMFGNDSSCGYCWAHTYPGENGPETCRDISVTDRLVKFMSALQDGAREAGSKLTVTVSNSRLYLDNNQHYHLGLKEGQYIDEKDRNGNPFAVSVASNSWFADGVFPVLGIPKAEKFVKELEKAEKSKCERMRISFGSVFPLLKEIYREFQKTPSKGPVSRMELLHRVAAKQVGEEHAEELLQAWIGIESAIERYRFCLRGAPLMIVGPLMMRWVTMPLIPDMSLLTEKERNVFQHGRVARNETEALRLTNTLGHPGITGEAAVDNARLVMHTAREEIRSAVVIVEGVAAKIRSKTAAGNLTSLVKSLKALSSILLTCRNVIEYEHTLSIRNRCDEEVWYRDQYNTGALNRGSYELRLSARSEMDNALALAKLLESSSDPILITAPSAKREDSLTFGLGLIKELRRKAEIMMKYWPLYNQLYPPVPKLEKLTIKGAP
ncbi:MAG: hypothetical protein KKF10_07690 [Verrucomicrobia bacterium]|nr:hypothetical protein [Verrucomicrobiota bacterium]